MCNKLGRSVFRAEVAGNANLISKNNSDFWE